MMAKKMKGFRANKPNDSFGTVNNKTLYRGKYREDVNKDEDEEVTEQQEEVAGPVEETATQETDSESFAKKTTQKEEVDYKKRYDDLKRHYDQKIEEFKSATKKVESDTQAIEVSGNLEAFRNKYPDVYDAVTQISSAKTESEISTLKEEIESLKGKEKVLQKQKAYEELLRLQPDFDDLKSNDKFLSWLEDQPQSISDGIYNNNKDAKWASRVVDLYKADSGGVKTPKLNQKVDAASSVSSASARDISSKDSKGKVWKASEIERMKPWEFEKLETEIDKARSEGRLDLSS
tara:strand:- start:784 stop:1656 length:873 start_codon:yes stop_codon:yes gene_type:complete